MNLKYTKQQLIDALEARRDAVRKYDSDQAKKHQRDEKEALKKFRARLREALKMDYTTVKKTYKHVGPAIANVACPSPILTTLENYIKTITASPQKRYTINPTKELHLMKCLFAGVVVEGASVCK